MRPNTSDKPVSLDAVLSYLHPGVVRRYCKEHGGDEREAEQVFRETLKWLYLCREASSGGLRCAITPELEKIDWMWHVFLLFTRDYADFCERHLGTFIHHLPTEDEGGAHVEDEETLRARLRDQFDLVYEVLGEETLTVWYDECLYSAPV